MEPNTGSSASERRPWMPGEESRQRTIGTAIDILRTNPFSFLTSRTLAVAADVSNSSISRNFGSMEGLFIAVVEELENRFAARSARGVGTELIDADVILRSRIVAWMLGEGMAPPMIGVERITSFSVNRKIRHEEVSDRTAWIFAQVALYLGEGFATFSPVHPKQNLSDPLDAMQLIDWIRAHLGEAERDLGWSNQTPNEA